MAGDLLYFFGYVDLEDSYTPFFYFEEHESASLSQNEGFKVWNESTLTDIATNSNDLSNRSQSLKSYEGFDRFLKLISQEAKDPCLINDNLPITIAE